MGFLKAQQISAVQAFNNYIGATGQLIEQLGKQLKAKDEA